MPLEELIDFQNFYVFEGVGITTSIITLGTDAKAGNFPVYKLKNGMTTAGGLAADLANPNLFEKYEAKQAALTAAPWSLSTPAHVI